MSSNFTWRPQTNTTGQNLWQIGSWNQPREEKDLAGFLIDSAKVGYGKSHDQVKSIAACGARDKGLLKPENF